MSPSPADVPPDGHARARSTGSLLRERSFGAWFAGNVISNSGNWLFNVTAAVVVYELSSSALLVGLVSVAQFLPMVLLAPLAGALADRLDRRRLLVGAQAAAATAATALAAYALVVGVDGFPSAWPVVLAALAIGTGLAISTPALNALVPALVDDVDLERAVSLTSLTFNVGRALGPAASGALLAVLGAEAAFAANALSFLALLAALTVVRTRRSPEPDGDGGEHSVRAGLAHVRRDRTLLLLLGAIAATGFAADPMITLAPPLSAAVGGGETLTAVLVSAFGIAAAPAAVASGGAQLLYGPLRVATVGLLTVAAGLLVAALAPSPVLAVAGFAGTGVGFVLSLTSCTAVLQRRVPEAMRGRVMALWAVAFLGMRPVAATIDGTAADLVGVRPAMGVAVAVALAGAVLTVHLRRRVATEAAQPN